MSLFWFFFSSAIYYIFSLVMSAVFIIGLSTLRYHLKTWAYNSTITWECYENAFPFLAPFVPPKFTQYCVSLHMHLYFCAFTAWIRELFWSGSRTKQLQEEVYSMHLGGSDCEGVVCVRLLSCYFPCLLVQICAPLRVRKYSPKGWWDFLNCSKKV